MLNINRMLRKQSSVKSVPLWVVEKDYAISYLLAAIADTTGLGDEIVLKGGTALKKAYFSEYRFSEDLDYSSLAFDERFDIENMITAAARKTEGLLQENGAFTVQLEPLILREPHPEGQLSFVLRVQFPYHRQPLCRLKIEISIQEPAILTPVRRSIIHNYPESFSAFNYVYPLEEIVAEKLRALLQSHSRLQMRGWGASRVCRDYYDIWWILNRVDLSQAHLPELTNRKCALKGFTNPSPSEFFSSALLDVVQVEWQQMLKPFIPNLPNAEVVLRETQAEVYRLWSEAK
jgi:predicted nucleotidyltransferase component of viral defense system